MPRLVAIVGRPNVGKSRLFNRLTRSRISIVHDQPGVTRDVVSAEVTDGAYTLMDTGGLGLKGGDSPAELTVASERQVEFAISSADLVLFVIDGLEGLTSLDAKIATMLRRGKKDVVLVVNKADFNDDKLDLGETYRLGLGEPIRFSAEHGRGEAELRTAILAKLGPAPEVAPAAPRPTTDENGKTVHQLKLVVDTYPEIVVKPRTVVWENGEERTDKTVTVRIATDSGVTLTGAAPDRDVVAVEIQPGETPGHRAAESASTYCRFRSNFIGIEGCISAPAALAW
jgi:small GTP-binding protein